MLRVPLDAQHERGVNMLHGFYDVVIAYCADLQAGRDPAQSLVVHGVYAMHCKAAGCRKQAILGQSDIVDMAGSA